MNTPGDDVGRVTGMPPDKPAAAGYRPGRRSRLCCPSGPARRAAAIPALHGAGAVLPGKRPWLVGLPRAVAVIHSRSYGVPPGAD